MLGKATNFNPFGLIRNFSSLALCQCFVTFKFKVVFLVE